MQATTKGRLVLSEHDYKNLCHRVLHRDKWRCRCCGRRFGLHAHHIVYRSQGGDDADYNLLTLCNHCHDGIHKPIPSTGAKLMILTPANANEPIQFTFVGGWRP